MVFVLLLGDIDLSLGYLTLLSVAITSSFSALQHWSAGAAILMDDGTIMTGEDLVARDKARAKLSPEERLLWSNDPRIWKRQPF